MADIPNHFQLIQRFRNMRAFDAHVSATLTVTFRDQIQKSGPALCRRPPMTSVYRAD